MKRIILLCAVALCFAVGQALKCYKCGFGFGDLCITTETTCGTGEQCSSGVGKAAGFLDIKDKGCLKEAECNKTSQSSLSIGSTNATVYTITRTCCNTDLCNAAPGLPGATGLSLVLSTLCALFVVNFLI
ncbi:lymphocyte antigen 6 complex locus protein G6d-like [Parambassis ranga]|uniref:Lymphocyte antigen 6 complex locus protein G6d-like n=1 Tax=Parambassis ranga TaxID=210632 RepID=A0A6P7K862_9TELE|nr:lymphocyte antigen 6 complex locus protein G6d-like [Parambassis ranga]XP_028285654.1 lymphocyte antigen 6 complex locus protein G6d-like [Parambassis ranga]